MKLLLSLGFFTTALLFSNLLTVYNNGFAYFYEKKNISVQKGIQSIKITNLPRSIVVDSIVPVFEDGIDLISQSYSNNPLNVNNLLEANLDKEVAFYDKEREKKILQGKLINIDPPIIESQHRYYIVKSSSIIFNTLPQNIDSKPYLIFDIDANLSKKSSVGLHYLLNDITWRSNYTLILRNNRLNLKAWATIINRSGKAFHNTALTLVAGNVNRHSSNIMAAPRLYRSKVLAMEANSLGATLPKSISGYHIYKIAKRVDLLNNQTKQFVLFAANEIQYKRYAVAQNNYFGNYGERKLRFLQQITFMNTKENGLGVPLPKGVLRIYRSKYYLGDAEIENTPKGERVKFTIGEFFDIVGKQKIIKYIVRDKYRDIETKYTLHNRGKEPIVVKLSENIPRYKDKAVFKTSCSGICSSKKINAFSREFTIKLKANESYSFTTEFEVYQ